METHSLSCVASGYIPPTYVQFGNIKIHCKTGEVEGLSENITEDAKFFWEQVKEHIIGERMARPSIY